jgi:hypothetical protein
MLFFVLMATLSQQDLALHPPRIQASDGHACMHPPFWFSQTPLNLRTTIIYSALYVLSKSNGIYPMHSYLPRGIAVHRV